MTIQAHKDRFTEGGLMDFAPNANKTIADRINRLIDAALEAENSAQPARDYLGGSRLGVECLRALYYEHAKAPVDDAPQFRGKTIRRFRLGHMHEEETADWLKKAGFDLRTHDKAGKQFGFKVANGKISGHLDGVFVGGPDVGVKYPALWEHKIMKSSKWKECDTKGVSKSHPVYWAQCHVYMAYMGLEQCLFTALNTDTSELLFQYFDLDASVAQWASDRGVQVISAKSALEMPRITRDKTDFKCRWCNWRERCHATQN